MFMEEELFDFQSGGKKKEEGKEGEVEMNDFEEFFCFE